jgi:uncharacterized membrane protein YphA (DoxX/SURF4 family)
LCLNRKFCYNDYNDPNTHIILCNSFIKKYDFYGISSSVLTSRSTGILFIFAATGKLLSQSKLKRTVHALPLSFLPVNGVAVITKALPWIELLLGTLLIMGAFLPYTAWVSITLLCVFSLVAILAVMKGANIPCSCFGGTSDEILSLKTVARNLIFIILVLPLTVPGRAYPSSMDEFLRSGFSRPNADQFLMLLFITAVIIGLSFLVSIARITISEGNPND